MSQKILIQIDPAALAPDKEGLPMRSESLSALKKLTVNGILLSGDRSRFSDLILRLLEQEKIGIADHPEPVTGQQSATGLQVGCDNSGQLILKGGPEPAQAFPGWAELARHLLLESRTTTHHRKTGETDISVSINLDGTGKSDINTGLPFYDHMLEQIARHGYMDLDIRCAGDLEIDEHHTIEDTAITLGEAIGMALGDKRGIGRYGFMVAMDETRSLVALDLSGRPWCEFEGEFRREKVGEFPTEMTRHFFHSLAMSLKATLHVAVKGENDHHQIEACFKGLARALRQAVDRNENYLDILPSSKGLL